jgi:hypothetical protein
MTRNTLGLIKTGLVFGLFSFLAIVYFHDAGVPETLTQKEREYVLCTRAEFHDATLQFTDDILLFVSHPEQERQWVDRLILDLNELLGLEHQMVNDRIFWVKDPAVVLTFQKTMESCITATETACDQMAKEVIQRVENDDFAQDEVGYRRLAQLLERIAATTPISNRDFCDQRKCFWCKCRRHWKFK